ncbi:Coagulation factor VIII [Exaiptasia diaphana]|nr:Coagulation factor VIII [Exaiptasia diaphana]
MEKLKLLFAIFCLILSTFDSSIAKSSDCGQEIMLTGRMMSASKSHFHPGLQPKNGIIGGEDIGYGAWAVARDRRNKYQWLQVTFDKLMTVTAVRTKGRSKVNHWVKTYSIEYSKNGVDFMPYKENGQIKEFQGNVDRDTEKRNQFSTPIEAIAIRFKPQTWEGYPAMRVGVNGCEAPEPEPTKAEPTTPPPGN